MNKAQKRPMLHKVLSMILALVMVLSLLPVSALAAATDTASNEFYRIVHLDCGRKYFSVQSIKSLIDAMAQYGYNQLELAFGNDGFRFLLNDENAGLSYKNSAGDDVSISGAELNKKLKDGIAAYTGNESERNKYLTETDMSAIISYANGKGIDIVPLLNMPGHAKVLVSQFDGYYTADYSVNLSNTEAVNFALAILQKYVDWFKDKVSFFSFGADEYNSYSHNCNTVDPFVVKCAEVISGAGMTPRAFNDSICYNQSSTCGSGISKNLQVCHWGTGWGSYPTSHAETLANNGFSLINTNGNWYYVLKPYEYTENNQIKYNNESKYYCNPAKNISVELPSKKDLPSTLFTYANNSGGTSATNNTKGAMFCIWCDKFDALTDDEVLSYDVNYGALEQIKSLAEKYWPEDINKEPTPSETPKADYSYTIAVDGYKSNTQTGNVKAVAESASDEYVNVSAEVKTIPGETKFAAASSISNQEAYIIRTSDDKYYTSNAGATADISQAAKWTAEKTSDGKYYLKNGNNYLLYSSDWTTTTRSMDATKFSFSSGELSYSYKNGRNTTTITLGTPGKSETTDTTYNTEITFTGLKPTPAGVPTLITIDGTTYSITVTKLVKMIDVVVGETKEINDDSAIEVQPDSTVATATSENGRLKIIGVKAGAETVVETANAKYTVRVKNLQIDVAPLKVELWITNRYVAETQQDAKAGKNTVNVKASDAHFAEGVALSAFVPSPAKDANGETDVFWKGVVLHNGEKQYVSGTTNTVNKDKDMSGAGDDFTKIRYWDDSWQYSTSNGWKNIDTSSNKDTVIAYYMQKFTVSNEINTTTRDFGNYAGNSDNYLPGWYGYIGYAAFSFAVVYPGYATSPKSEDDIYKTTTMLRYVTTSNIADQSLTPGIVYAENNSDYTIEKITITRGDHAQNTAYWKTDDSINWNKKVNEAGREWYDETTVWEAGNSDYSEIPYVNFDGSEWYAEEIGDSFLILIYLKPVPKQDNLNVVYWDDSANTQINPNDIQIVVNEGVTFTNSLKDKTGNIIGDNAPWPKSLPDGAYITNSSNVDQTFNSDITIIDGVAANYRSGIYEQSGVTISEDGKTLTLHYKIKSADSVHQYVVDFGLPVEFTGLLGWFNVENVNTVEYLSVASAKEVTESTGSFGSVKINTETWNSMTYTLDKTLNAVATIPLYCKIADGDTLSTQIQVIPASTVYYEDSFASFANGKGAAEKAEWSNINDNDETVAENRTYPAQALEALGAVGNNVYGYDEKYANSATYSMGSAHKVTVTSAMVENWNNDSAWPTATFTFKGTGFDIISLTNSDAGAIMYTVTNKETGESFSRFINNYYGYEYKDGKWTTTTDKGAIYQVPIIKVSDLAYGTYEVEISVRYGAYFDENNDGQYSFWLDAIRVYDPMGKDYADYAKDNEASPNYVEVKQVILDTKALENENATGAVFIDGKGSAGVSAADYENFGPNHEAYLANEQAIAFQLVANGEPESVQLGAKLAKGDSAALTIIGATCGKANNGALTLETATDMYYELTNINWTAQGDGTYKSDTITLTNNSTDANAIISLTNIKFIGAKYTNAIADVKNAVDEVLVTFAVSPAMVSEAVNAVSNVLSSASEPFAPERFEAKWNSVRKGQTATLTVKASTDVEAITVNGVTVDSYKTRTERTGILWWAQKVEYREFTYSTTANESADFTVCAVNAEGVASEHITATLTVKPAQNSGWWNNWWNGIFDKWF